MYEATVCLGDNQAGGLGARHGMELVWYYPCCKHGTKESWSPIPRKLWEIRERSRSSDHWDKWKPNIIPKVWVRNGRQDKVWFWRQSLEKFHEVVKWEWGAFYWAPMIRWTRDHGRSTEVVQTGPSKSLLIKPTLYTQAFLKPTHLLLWEKENLVKTSISLLVAQGRNVELSLTLPLLLLFIFSLLSILVLALSMVREGFCWRELCVLWMRSCRFYTPGTFVRH